MRCAPLSDPCGRYERSSTKGIIPAISVTSTSERNPTRIEEEFNADKTLLVNVRPSMVHTDTFDGERIVRVVFHPATRGKQIDPRKLAMHTLADEAREFARQLIGTADDLSA